MNVKDNKQEIITISCRIYEDISLNDANSPEKLPCQLFSITRPINQLYPAGFEKLALAHQGMISLQKTEIALLCAFLAKLHQVDPDVLIGHQLENVDYGILLHRMKEKKIGNWHRIGRVKRSSWPQYGGRMAGSFFAERHLAAGRLICDLANDLGKVCFFLDA
jgi:DNA polymerase alpha subunit A